MERRFHLRMTVSRGRAGSARLCERRMAVFKSAGHGPVATAGPARVTLTFNAKVSVVEL